MRHFVATTDCKEGEFKVGSRYVGSGPCLLSLIAL
jgi:hypothetical protein